MRTSEVGVRYRAWSFAALLGVAVFAQRLALAAEELDFRMTVWDSGFSEREITGRLLVEGGKFSGTFNQSGVRLHLWCEVNGDAVAVSGSVKTGFSPYPSNFSVKGSFEDGRFEQRYFSSGANSYRGTVIVSRITE